MLISLLDIKYIKCSEVNQVVEGVKSDLRTCPVWVSLACSELAMILSMSHTNPAMFGMVAETPAVAQQLQRLARLKELMETDEEQLKAKQSEDWARWLSRYRSQANTLSLGAAHQL